MSGWVRGGPRPRRWHQAEVDARTGVYTLLCSGRAIRVGDEDEVMDYRWRPPWGEQCRHPQCHQEVEP
jgi:hypothetical protein